MFGFARWLALVALASITLPPAAPVLAQGSAGPEDVTSICPTWYNNCKSIRVCGSCDEDGPVTVTLHAAGGAQIGDAKTATCKDGKFGTSFTKGATLPVEARGTQGEAQTSGVLVDCVPSLQLTGACVECPASPMPAAGLAGMLVAASALLLSGAAGLKRRA